MKQWDIFKEKVKNEHGITLTDEDRAEYKKIVKASTPEVIGLIIGAIIILFIAAGLVLNELPFDQYTFIPLAVVACLTVTSGNSLTKKMKQSEQKFIEHVKAKYAPTTPTPNILRSSAFEPNQKLKTTISEQPQSQPKAAANCPVCHQLIPVNSNPCPKCGSKLVWD
ncbi:MAG: hypothetical protein ACTSR7_20660 [Promethearchaeota archaeon]